MRRLILGILLMISFRSFSQEQHFKIVDSTTYYYYTNQEWRALADYGKKAEMDYYYFNIRMGVANFNLKRYLTAVKYLKKAIANNRTDFANQYLFWNYQQLGENILAERIYEQLTEQAKKEINFSKPFIESIYLEGGLKIPNTQAVGKTTYGLFALQHRLSKHIRMTHSFNYFSQNRQGQDITNMQYNFFGNYYIKNSALGLGAIIASSNLNESFPDSITTPFDDTIPANAEGSVVSNTNSFFINYNWRIHRLKINLNCNYVTQTAHFNYTTKAGPPPGAMYGPNQPPPLTEVADSSIERNSVIPSFSLSYIPKFFKDRVSVGAEVFVPISNKQTNFVLNPILNVSITDKFWLNTNYLQVKEFLFADYASGLLYNNLYLSEKRFSGTLNFIIVPKSTFIITYTLENFEDSYEKIKYNTNSIFLGIQFKF